MQNSKGLRRFYWRSFVITFTLSVFCAIPSLAWAGLTCTKQLRSKFDPVETAIEIEAQITKINHELFDLNLSNHHLAKDLNRSKSIFERIVDEIGRVSLDTTSRDIESLQHTLDKISDQVFVISMRRTNVDFDKVIEDPRLAKPDFLYPIKSMDPHFVRVSFTKDVLENVFWSEESTMVRASGLIMSALLKGRLHATSGSGVESFIDSRDVFKVKIRGSSAGAVRVAGYFVGTDYHIVAWDDEGNHTSKTTARMIENVRRVRDRKQ